MKIRASYFNILFSFVVALSACSKTVEHRPQGGQDSGGGNTTVSTLEDVQFYYERAQSQIEFVLSKLLDTRTIYSFSSARKRQLLYGVSEKILALDTESDAFNPPTLKKGLQNLIASSEVNIKNTSHCSSKDKTHASASIRDYKVGSPICLSFSELRKLPKSSLEREIISLLFHEYVHALGYEDEKTVMVIQNALVQNYDRLFPDGTKDFEQRLGHRDRPFYMERLSFLNKYVGNLDTFVTYEFTLPPSENNEEWESADYDDSVMTDVCKNIYSVKMAISSIQKEDQQVLTRMGPQLVDSGDISDAKIDEHLNRVDSLRYSISEKTKSLERICNSDLTSILKRESDHPRNVKAIKEELKAFAAEITEFLKVVAETDGYIQKYN